MYFDYRNSGLADSRFYYPFFQNDILEELVTLYYVDENGIGSTNGNWFTFESNVKSVKISFYKDFNDQTTLESTFNFNLLEPSEAFSIENIGGESCFSFDNFHASWSTILDGFCSQDLSGKITPVPPFGNDVNPDFEYHINFDGAIDISSSFANFCDDCNNAHAPAGLSYEQPCGCLDFELTIEPCNNTNPGDCPPLILDLDIMICCECDVRNITVFD